MTTKQKAKPAAKPRAGNQNAKGRSAKRPTFSVVVDGTVEATTPIAALALDIGAQYFADRKSVIVRDNSARRTMERFIYGHRQ